MKTFAAKKQDGSIYLIQCKSTPEAFLQDVENDTLLNEVTDSNPMPNRAYRDQWSESNGDLVLDQTAVDTKDRSDKLQAIRDLRDPLLDEADKEIFKLEDSAGDASAWRSYRASLRTLTDSYKDGNGNPNSSLDAISDAALDVSWPAKP